MLGPRGALRLISARTGTLIRTLSPAGSWYPGDWSPDGREIVVWRDGTLVAYPVGGGEARVIADTEEFHDEAYLRLGVAWSPSGRWIAWIAGRWRARRRIYTHATDCALWRVRAEGGAPQRVKSVRINPPPDSCYDPEALVWYEPKLAWQPRSSDR